MTFIWNTSCKKCILWGRDIKSMFLFFFYFHYISFQDMQSVFEFLVSVINHYHNNGLNLFWDSFEWFLSPDKLWRKKVFLFCRRHCDQGLIVVNYFQIWNKKEHIFICRVISNQKNPIYGETQESCRAGRNSPGSMEDQTIRRHTAPTLQRSIQSKSDR